MYISYRTVGGIFGFLKEDNSKHFQQCVFLTIWPSIAAFRLTYVDILNCLVCVQGSVRTSRRTYIHSFSNFLVNTTQIYHGARISRASQPFWWMITCHWSSIFCILKRLVCSLELRHIDMYTRVLVFSRSHLPSSFNSARLRTIYTCNIVAA